MNIVVLGAGAMGSLFGGRLSARHDVTLADADPVKVAAIRERGVSVLEGEREERFSPRAALPADIASPSDLLIVFVKALHTRAALDGCRGAIGPDTLLLTLQNGAGHETILRDFAPEDHIALGVTQHNASLLAPGRVRHGGGGATYLGMLPGRSASRALENAADALAEAGFSPARIVGDIREEIWKKLMMNASSSALTGVLQARQGLCEASESARALLRDLIREGAAVARAEGIALDADTLIPEIEARLRAAPSGLTSVCADIRDGRRTEADFITGAVVAAARRTGTPAPTHETVLRLLHALEDRARLPEYSVTEA